MRISYLAAPIIVSGIISLGTPAFANCTTASCSSSGNAIIYGSGSYDAHSKPTQYRPSAHVNQGMNTRFGVAQHTIPFTTTVSKISKHRVAGMAHDEFLSPTKCPVNVYNPGGHKVLGCYSVVKQAQKIKHVPQIHYQQVRVVRPIIYVRYPVPTPMPVPAPICRSQALVCGSSCNDTTYSRYGNIWPRMGSTCARW